MKQVMTSIAGVLMVAALVLGQGKPGTEAPRFRVDPAWPKIPNSGNSDRWPVSRSTRRITCGSCSDPARSVKRRRDGQRHRSWNDEAGNFIQAWGGPGQGYEWPNSEHGVYIDPKGFVWIGGNGDKDHQILKFTKAGKFVMQIGRAGQSKGNADTQNLNQPADAFVYAKTNELIVADGYGNRRVIVFDADSGKFKRMWGAFGNVPTDAAPNPAPPDTDPEGAPQFMQPVHAARVSNDGMVYVSDRGGKRVQVFTLAGKYVNQVFIGRECKAPECGNGTTAASTAFSADPAQQFLYVGNRSQARVMVFDRRTLTLLDSFGQWGSAPVISELSITWRPIRGQSVCDGSDAAQTGKQAHPEIHLHGPCAKQVRRRQRDRRAPRLSRHANGSVHFFSIYAEAALDLAQAREAPALRTHHCLRTERASHGRRPADRDVNRGHV